MNLSLSGPDPHDGLAQVAFVSRGDGTDLARLYQRGSLRVFRPNAPSGDLPNAVLLNTSGGIVGGDRLAVEVRMQPGAAALITSQAAEKVYRTSGREATVTVRLDLADRARLRRSLSVEAAAEARLLAADLLAFGRRARGERFRHGALHDRIEIRSATVWSGRTRCAWRPSPARCSSHRVV
jgi:urease accessory protein